MAGKPKPSERIQIYLSPTTAADRLLLKVWKASRGQVHVQPLFRQILAHGLKVMHERGDLPRDVYKIKELVELLGPMPERPAHPSAPSQPMVVHAAPYGYPMPAGMPMPPGYGWPMPMHPGFAPQPAHHPGAFAPPPPPAPAPAPAIEVAPVVAPSPVAETPFRTIPAREPDEGAILTEPSGRVVPLVPEMVERAAPVVVPPPQAIEAATAEEGGVTSPVPAPGVGILALMGTRRN